MEASYITHKSPRLLGLERKVGLAGKTYGSIGGATATAVGSASGLIGAAFAIDGMWYDFIYKPMDDLQFAPSSVSDTPEDLLIYQNLIDQYGTTNPLPE
jgi:hypothetical protein